MYESRGVNTSVKVILLTGIMVFVFMYVVSSGLKSALKPNDRERVGLRAPSTPFDAKRAYGMIEALCAMGSRVSGTRGAERAREFIKEELQDIGLSVEEQVFQVTGEDGPVEGVNLIATVKGGKESCIVVLGHYDTFDSPDGVHPGANSGGASTAMLLELAKAYGSSYDGRTVVFAFLDRTYEPEISDKRDATRYHGAQALARHLKASLQIDAAFSFEGLGDCFLRAGVDEETPAWMREILLNISDRMRFKRHFNGEFHVDTTPVTAFRSLGIPGGHLQDISYGGSPVEHEQYWLTPEDTPDRVCVQSLQAAGNVLYDSLRTFDRRLDYMAAQ